MSRRPDVHSGGPGQERDVPPAGVQGDLDRPLSELGRRVGEALVRRGWTLAVAESCTGGLISKVITDVPGSSRYLQGAVIAYANAAKRDVLGVSPEALERAGAVSSEVARAMAVGAVRAFGADVGLSVTGIAGPGGATPGKPVGTVWFGLATPETISAERIRFAGDRGAVRARAAAHALALLIGNSEAGRSA